MALTLPACSYSFLPLPPAFTTNWACRAMVTISNGVISKISRVTSQPKTNAIMIPDNNPEIIWVRAPRRVPVAYVFTYVDHDNYKIS